MAASVSSDDDAVVSDINVTPLVDVVLVLLIVFMITMPAMIGAAPIKIDLPEGAAMLAGDISKLPLNFTLKSDGNREVLYLESNVVDDALLNRIVRENQPIDEQSISLKADKEIPYGNVIKALDRLAGFGLQKISLDIKSAR